MALRDQPYIPLYVQDIMTDEKLNECCAATHGIYIKGIMCLMHKSEEYGKILLKQKDKQTSNQVKNFASKIAKHTPYSEHEIEVAITELLAEDVVQMDGDCLSQKRMVKDGNTSINRSLSGGKGGKITQENNKKFASSFAKANNQPNSEYEYVNESENEKGKKWRLKKQTFTPPSIGDVEAFFESKGFNKEFARTAFDHYDLANWFDSNGKQVISWKSKMNTNWLKAENKLKHGIANTQQSGKTIIKLGNIVS